MAGRRDWNGEATSSSPLQSLSQRDEAIAASKPFPAGDRLFEQRLICSRRNHMPSIPCLESPESVYDVRSRAVGPMGKLPLTESMLREWASGDLFGLTQNALVSLGVRQDADHVVPS
jgi:hypothetical protein